MIADGSLRKYFVYGDIIWQRNICTMSCNGDVCAVTYEVSFMMILFWCLALLLNSFSYVIWSARSNHHKKRNKEPVEVQSCRHNI
jgi:hypothetical protein